MIKLRGKTIMQHVQTHFGDNFRANHQGRDFRVHWDSKLHQATFKPPDLEKSMQLYCQHCHADINKSRGRFILHPSFAATLLANAKTKDMEAFFDFDNVEQSKVATFVTLDLMPQNHPYYLGDHFKQEFISAYKNTAKMARPWQVTLKGKGLPKEGVTQEVASPRFHWSRLPVHSLLEGVEFTLTVKACIKFQKNGSYNTWISAHGDSVATIDGSTITLKTTKKRRLKVSSFTANKTKPVLFSVHYQHKTGPPMLHVQLAPPDQFKIMPIISCNSQDE